MSEVETEKVVGESKVPDTNGIDDSVETLEELTNNNEMNIKDEKEPEKEVEEYEIVDNETVDNQMMDNEIVEEKIGYRDVFKLKEYMKLIVANVINRFGDSVDSIAFTWLVYQITGSASWSAMVFAFNMIPSVIVQPFAGALVESLNKKKVMVISDFLRGINITLFAVIFMTGHLEPFMFIIFTLINSTVEAFRVPSGMSFVPKIIDEKYYVFASALNNTISRIVEMIGLGLAGVIIAILGVHTAILIDAVTFFASCFIISLIKVKKEEKMVEKLSISNYLNTLKGGLDNVVKNPIIRNICLLAVALNAILVPYSSFEAPLIQEIYKQGSGLLSALGIGFTIGMGIGASFYPYINKKLKARQMIVISGIVAGFVYVTFILLSYISTAASFIYPSVIAITMIFGICFAIINSVVSVQFMKEVDKEYYSRTGAILNASATAATPVFGFLCTIFAKSIDVSKIYVASGILCIILFIYVSIRKVRFEKE